MTIEELREIARQLEVPVAMLDRLIEAGGLDIIPHGGGGITQPDALEIYVNEDKVAGLMNPRRRNKHLDIGQFYNEITHAFMTRVVNDDSCGDCHWVKLMMLDESERFAYGKRIPGKGGMRELRRQLKVGGMSVHQTSMLMVEEAMSELIEQIASTYAARAIFPANKDVYGFPQFVGSGDASHAESTFKGIYAVYPELQKQSVQPHMFGLSLWLMWFGCKDPCEGQGPACDRKVELREAYRSGTGL